MRWAALLIGAAGCGGAATQPREGALWFGGDVHARGEVSGRLTAVTAAMNGAAGVVNLEGPVGEGPGLAEITSDRVRLENSAQTPRALAQSGVVAATVVNNHDGDDEEAGRTRTVEALRGAGLTPVGGSAGPAHLEVNGHVVTLLAFALEPGAPSPPPELKAQLASASGEVAVAFHTTGAPSYLPPPELISAVDAALAGGAAVVVAHGSHRVGSIERRGDAVIAWGLGNLLFDCPCTDESEALVLRVSLAPGHPAELVPIQAGLNGAPALLAPDGPGLLDLVDGLGGTPLRRDRARGAL